jgi:hypothetical protein
MPETQVIKLVDEWRDRKTNAMLAFAGNLLQRKNQPRSLVQDGVPVESESELAVA